MTTYKVLSKQIFKSDPFCIVPIRSEDRFRIMKWRNEQIYHLRQKEFLNKESQNKYFDTIIKSSFNESCPRQILFSMLKNQKCIGYGGLVHINWEDKNAEISFIMDTDLEKKSFYKVWYEYLKIIQQVAFKDLKLHKIYTFAFDLRPQLYDVLLDSGFNKEARLKQHCFFNSK